MRGDLVDPLRRAGQGTGLFAAQRNLLLSTAPGLWSWVRRRLRSRSISVRLLPSESGGLVARGGGYAAAQARSGDTVLCHPLAQVQICSRVTLSAVSSFTMRLTHWRWRRDAVMASGGGAGRSCIAAAQCDADGYWTRRHRVQHLSNTEISTSETRGTTRNVMRSI